MTSKALFQDKAFCDSILPALKSLGLWFFSLVHNRFICRRGDSLVFLASYKNISCREIHSLRYLMGPKLSSLSEESSLGSRSTMRGNCCLSRLLHRNWQSWGHFYFLRDREHVFLKPSSQHCLSCVHSVLPKLSVAQPSTLSFFSNFWNNLEG